MGQQIYCRSSSVSGEYPRKYDTGKPITGLDTITKSDDVVIFHAGTGNSTGRFASVGGRVIGRYWNKLKFKRCPQERHTPK